jgi:methylmalonyl-CoA mutase cobalamin-binding subunit
VSRRAAQHVRGPSSVDDEDPLAGGLAANGVEPVTLRRRRKAVVVVTGLTRTGDSTARALAQSLERLGIETSYLGRHDSASQLAAVVDAERPDAVELCIGRPGGALFLRDLLRELCRRGRREVSIVVHDVK